MGLDPKIWWYVTRASGFVSWALLAVAVLWGLFITNKTLTRSTAPAWVLDLHRHLGGLAVVFVAVHVGALPLDTYTDWGWSDLFLPMASAWHPGAIAWGIVALYLLVAIELSSLLGRRFPKKWWRRVHMLSFPLYVLASIHLFAAGTDGGNAVARWMVVITSTLIAFLTGVRVLAAAKPRETRANPRTAAVRAQAAPAKPAAPAKVPASAAAASESRSDTLLPLQRPEPSTPRAAGPIANPAEPTRPGPKPLTVDERAEQIRGQARATADRTRSDGGPRERIPAAARAAAARRS